MSKVDIMPEHLEIVLSILNKYTAIEPELKTYVFGSRATGKTRQYSDLDLALDINKPIELGFMADIKTDFDDSDLPYKVDVVDLHSIDPAFKRLILASIVLLS